MKYFSGFSLTGEGELFREYIGDSGDFTVAGFSYGAIEAFEYVYNNKRRVDRLVLLSPAFFQTQKRSFIRAQLRYFDSDRESYIKQFLINLSYPLESDTLSQYISVGERGELEMLLNYHWDSKKLKELIERGITIEVYLGGEDKIINSQDACDFFQDSSIVYYIKDVGHSLI